jgi:hypothetical protein
VVGVPPAPLRFSILVLVPLVLPPPAHVVASDRLRREVVQQASLRFVSCLSVVQSVVQSLPEAGSSAAGEPAVGCTVSQLYGQLYSRLHSQLHSQLHSRLHSQLYCQVHSAQCTGLTLWLMLPSSAARRRGGGAPLCGGPSPRARAAT